MLSSSKFPETLLSQSIKARKNYFSALMIGHPLFMQVLEELLATIYSSPEVRLIIVLSCPGVGATSLMHHFSSRLIEDRLADLKRCPGYIPVFFTEAVAEGLKRFSWNDLFQRALRGLGETMINDKIIYDDWNNQDQPESTNTSEHTFEDVLQQALVQCIHHRQLTAFNIDEAQHLLRKLKVHQIPKQRHRLMSLATEAVWVLFGNYELLPLVDSDPSIHVIHFRRYRAEIEEDTQTFRNILSILQSHLPIHREPSLTDKWEYFYERSLGTVGLLKAWFTRALYLALKDNQKRLSKEYLERSAISTARLFSSAEKIITDEIAVEEIMNKRNKFK